MIFQFYLLLNMLEKGRGVKLTFTLIAVKNILEEESGRQDRVVCPRSLTIVKECVVNTMNG